MSEKESSTDSGYSLPRYLSSVEAWGLSLGCGIGWGAFLMPGTTFLPNSGPVGTVLGMAVAAMAMLIIARNYSYMMQNTESPGGAFTYTQKFFGNDHGFLCGWFLFLTYVSLIWANSSAITLLCRYLFHDSLQFGFSYRIADYDVYFGEVLATGTLVTGVGLICSYFYRFAVRINVLLAVMFFIGVISCFIGVVSNSADKVDKIFGYYNNGMTPLSQILHIIAITPWAFVGFESISNSSAEVTFKKHRFMSVMVFGILAIFLCYTFLTVVSAVAIPNEYLNWSSYVGSLRSTDGFASVPVLAAVFNKMGGTGLIIISLAMLGALITSVIGNSIASSRLLFCLSKEHVIPSWFSVLNRNNIPVNAFYFIIAISVIIPFFGHTAVGWNVDVCTIGAMVAYGYTSAATYRLADRKADHKMKLVAGIGLVMAVLFSLFLLIPNFLSGGFLLANESYLFLTVWALLGFIIFRWVFFKDQHRRFGNSTIVWRALVIMIFFTSLMWIHRTTITTTENAIDSVSGYCVGHMIDHGIDPSAMHIIEGENYKHEQVEIVHDSLLKISLIQIVAMLLSLAVMFSVISLMNKRERKMEVEKVRAEQRSRAKSIFLSNMSHDIRTPMNAIIGYTDIASSGHVSPEQMQDYLKKINMSSHYLLDLINDILEMSRIESDKIHMNISVNNIEKVMLEIEEFFSGQMKLRNISYKVRLVDIQDPWVKCDVRKLNRIMLNLLSNACKFTRIGGHVLVKLVQTGRNDGRASFDIIVKDDGIGMSKEFSGKVFEAFERERTSTVSGIYGTGLGMAITKHFVELMDGTIELETQLNKGTTFTIHLTFDIADEPDTIYKDIFSDGYYAECFKGKRVLLVEDIRINREIAVMNLHRLGFVVETAEDGRQAVEKVEKSSKGYYDAILMDIQMPVMNGHEATKAIRRLENPDLASIPIVAMTANAFSEDIIKEEQSGMNGHISKPINIKEIAQTLGMVLNVTEVPEDITEPAESGKTSDDSSIS